MGDEHEIEEFLRRTPAPRLAEGHHKAALKRDLLRRMAVGDSTIRKEGQAMGRWGRKLAWTCAAAVLLAGTVWAAQKVRRVFRVREALGDVTVSSRNGPRTYHASRGGMWASDDPEFTQADAEREVREIRQLIAEGKGELVEVVDSAFGVKTYIVEVVLASGKKVRTGSGAPRGYDRTEEDVLQEVVNLMDAGKGEHVGVGEYEWGRLYWYRFVLSDGFVTAHAEPEPYLGNEEAAFDEIKALVESGQAELLWGPSTGDQQACYEVTLSDGRVMYYTCAEEL